MDNIRADQIPGALVIRARQDVDLSAEARRALRAGVPLRFKLELSLIGDASSPPGAAQGYSYEIRYLPLSERYQLTGPVSESPPRTYPRLRHALAALGSIELQLAALESGSGKVEVRLRSRLDLSAMPGPMQLPVLLSPDWKHDSGWVSQSFELSG